VPSAVVALVRSAVRAVPIALHTSSRTHPFVRSTGLPVWVARPCPACRSPSPLPGRWRSSGMSPSTERCRSRGVVGDPHLNAVRDRGAGVQLQRERRLPQRVVGARDAARPVHGRGGRCAVVVHPARAGDGPPRHRCRPRWSVCVTRQHALACQPLLLLMLALYFADRSFPAIESGLSRTALYRRRRRCVRKGGIADRVESGRPRQARLEDSRPVRTRWAAACRWCLGREHRRLLRAPAPSTTARDQSINPSLPNSSSTA
jgi:hypothetical protein